MAMDDLITYFRILKPRTSCSFDKASMFMLKLAMPRIVSSLVLYYLCISKCYFPSVLKKNMNYPCLQKGIHQYLCQYTDIPSVQFM